MAEKPGDTCRHQGGTIQREEGDRLVTRCAEPWCGRVLNSTKIGK